MKWWMHMNQPNAVFPQVHCERQLSMWHMYFYDILCLNVVMFNISFVFEIFASHPQPPNEGLGVPCPKQGTTTWIANPTWSKKCMQIYLPVRVVIQRLNPQCCATKKIAWRLFVHVFVCMHLGDQDRNTCVQYGHDGHHIIYTLRDDAVKGMSLSTMGRLLPLPSTWSHVKQPRSAYFPGGTCLGNGLWFPAWPANLVFFPSISQRHCRKLDVHLRHFLQSYLVFPLQRPSQVWVGRLRWLGELVWHDTADHPIFRDARARSAKCWHRASPKLGQNATGKLIGMYSRQTWKQPF